jgi:hypothetical protein
MFLEIMNKITGTPLKTDGSKGKVKVITERKVSI